MKRLIFITSAILFMNCFLSAQKSEPVTVKAGDRVIDYFPFTERYLYPRFTEGKVIFDNGKAIPNLLNYNVLYGEMEFIQLADTLYISDKKNINSIVIAQDTFYYYNGYMQVVRNGSFKVYLKQLVEIKDIIKKGAFGTANRAAASDSYSYLLTGPRSFNLTLDEDMVLQKTAEFFFSISGYDFIPLNKKNIIKSLPGKENVINDYLKSNKIHFDSTSDILKLSGFLNNLLSKKTN